MNFGSPCNNLVASPSISSCPLASSSATRNENSTRNGAAANCAILDANELVNETLLLRTTVRKTEVSGDTIGRLWLFEGGLRIVKMGSVMKRQRRVATRMRGKKMVAKARPIWKRRERECVRDEGLEMSSVLDGMLFGIAISASLYVIILRWSSGDGNIWTSERYKYNKIHSLLSFP
jgi:hypothetical protein